MPRRFFFALLAVLTLASLGPVSAHGRDLYFGISANSRSAKVPGDVQDAAAETGVTRLREDLEWQVVEPENNAWDWTRTDLMYEEAAERGMSILPIPNSPPCWAVPKPLLGEEIECDRKFPKSNAEYAEFVGQVAARYGPGGDFWDDHSELDGSLASRYIEIWNEPYWMKGGLMGTPAEYASLYKAAVEAGRAANLSTRYLIESTVDGAGGVHWAEKIYAAVPSIGSYIDGIASHPYPGSHGIAYQPTSGTDEAFVNVRIDYERWKSLEINRPVWITEVGYSSCDDGPEKSCVDGASQGARESNKAALLKPLLEALGTDEYGFVHAVYLYNLRQTTPASQPDNKKSNWYGISFGGSFEQLPAWTTFTEAVAAYDGLPEANTTIASQTISGESASFSFSGNDSTARFECKLDAGAWGACTSPKSYNPTGGGSHTFQARATNAESVEASPATYSWVTAPTATTEAASGVKETEATLNATVNPKGTNTSYHFEYGTSPVLTNSTPDKAAGSGISNVKLSEPLTGLSPDTSYGYRIVATNAAGVVTKGAEQTFKTAKTIPSSLVKLLVIEPFDGNQGPFGGPTELSASWTKLGWAASKGQDTSSGWAPSSAYPTLDGSYSSGAGYNDGGFGYGIAGTLTAGAQTEGRYFSLVLAKFPVIAREAYELRFKWTGSDQYTVSLSKWVNTWSGAVETTLASTTKFSLFAGSSFALVDGGGVVSAWVDAGSGFSQVLSASDSTYSVGRGGLSGSGTATRISNFRAGAL